MGALPLEVLPELEDWLLSQLVLECTAVALCAHQVKEGGICIKLVPRADNSNIGVPVPLER